MIATDFPEANKYFGPPKDLDPEQCQTIRAHVGVVQRGSVEGLPMIITAWKPTAAELADLNAGAPVYVTFVSGGLPPHFLTTQFAQATNPS